MLELAVAVVALCQVVRTVMAVTDRHRREYEETTDPHVAMPRTTRYPDVVIPVGCGIAVKYDGMTDECARRRGHQGRCMGEDEIENIADHGRTTALDPESAPATETELRVDIAALGRHVDSCPLTLFSSPHLTADELAWVSRTRLMVEALASGDRFSEWGKTKA